MATGSTSISGSHRTCDNDFLLLQSLITASQVSTFTRGLPVRKLVLIACFLGFGLGCHLSRRRANLLLLVVPLTTLTLLIKLPWRSLRTLMGLIPALVGASSEVHVWGVHPEFSFPLLVAAIAIIVPIFSLI